jgi:hypothetical protein
VGLPAEELERAMYAFDSDYYADDLTRGLVQNLLRAQADAISGAWIDCKRLPRDLSGVGFGEDFEIQEFPLHDGFLLTMAGRLIAVRANDLSRNTVVTAESLFPAIYSPQIMDAAYERIDGRGRLTRERLGAVLNHPPTLRSIIGAGTLGPRGHQIVASIVDDNS